VADRIRNLLTAVNAHTGDTRPTRPRARFAATGRTVCGVPDAVERYELARTVGAAVRALREAAGMSQEILARRMGAARSTVERLEAGRRRPTPSLLASVVVAAGRTAPPRPADHRAEVQALTQLLDAAGASLAVDTAGGVARRERRLHDAGKAWARAYRRAHEAEVSRRRGELAGFRRAMGLLDGPGALDDVAVLDRVERLLSGRRAGVR
jgi:transcriptional regulator with XRE-family HTH domain